MAKQSRKGRLACQPDLKKWSATFAKRARAARENLGIEMEYLSDLTRIDVARLELLETGGEVCRASEIQLVGVILGVGLDELFRLPNTLSQTDIHKKFLNLKKHNMGLIAATPGDKAAGLGVDQDAFERSVVHLHHCAECLAKFPQ